MVTVAKVSLILEDMYRVDVDGQISAPISLLASGYKVSFVEGLLIKEPPELGDKVLCWFPSEALCNGYIIGSAEV